MYANKQAYYGDEAAGYDYRRTGIQVAWAREYDVVKKLCRQWPQGSTILDVPCGTGRLFPLFHQSGHKAWGMDISADMLAAITCSRRKLTSLHGLIRADAERLPFADGSFDYVVCLRLFHFLPVKAAETILREFCRIARKGVVVHGGLENGNLLPKVADAIAQVKLEEGSLVHKVSGTIEEVRTSGWRIPAVLARKTKRTVRHMGALLLRGHLRLALKKTVINRQDFLCTPKELTRVVGQVGFSVKKSYGSISPFS